ncbi:MAG: hypothetical protein IIB38_09490 [Candidatus Hydrogenedentes bacterium]|nr:hypothetical protein [Candidatus Hydrogenedentota bacterium]
MNKTINNNRLGRAEKRPAIRALTILQPYAHLIATGEKFVENRCWRIRNPPRYIVIHAGKGHRLLEYDDEGRYSEMVFGAFVAVAFLSAVIDVRDRDGFAIKRI